MKSAMSTTFLQLAPLCMLLSIVQFIAAVPWLVALWGISLTKDLAALAKGAGVAAVIGIALAFFLQTSSEPGAINLLGRLNASLLTLQIGLDFFVLAYYCMLTFWPKGGAVALAAFYEGIRQPMFWLLTFLGGLAMVVSIVIPYFTFGEDLKMVKEITYALTMIFPAIFGVISASISVSEEIEGRTAVTLLSKPISRRDFLFGKFAGLTLAGAFMTMLMGWVLIWVVLAKFNYDFQPGITQLPPDPAWVNRMVEETYGPTVAGDLLRGTGLWFRDLGEALPGLIIGFGQVMTLIAVSVALATRLPMVVNLTMCMFIYFLGHLAPILTAVSQDLRLVQFIAQLFEFLLPGLANFDVSSAIVRDVPLDPERYALYTFNVFIYATIYTSIALLGGLILFEDRDVA